VITTSSNDSIVVLAGMAGGVPSVVFVVDDDRCPPARPSFSLRIFTDVAMCGALRSRASPLATWKTCSD